VQIPLKSRSTKKAKNDFNLFDNTCFNGTGSNDSILEVLQEPGEKFSNFFLELKNRFQEVNIFLKSLVFWLYGPNSLTHNTSRQHSLNTKSCFEITGTTIASQKNPNRSKP